jgi:DNA-directed RNA polymerase subunit RPC12/RpoP
MLIREIECPYCPGFAYQTTSDLKRHIETVHEKRRDHACPHCPSAFGQKSTLRTHVETVHEKRRDHACPYCDGVAFGTAGTLKNHISAVHLKIKCST